jgi:hypothetical protein
MTTTGSTDASPAVHAVEAFYAALADGDLPATFAPARRCRCLARSPRHAL